jgi:thymidylate synthase (FAD)
MKLQFLTLRLDPAAQWEIRQYAHAVGEVIKQIFPITWRLFQEGYHD